MSHSPTETKPSTETIMSPTVVTRFIVMSDTHNFEFNDTSPQPLTQPTPRADVLLHCGDLTQLGGISDFKKAIKMLGSIDAELKLVIAGNHDMELDASSWASLEDPEVHVDAVNVMTGSLAQEAGVTYLTEGTHTFTLSNGANFTIYTSPWTPEYNDFAFGYEHNHDRFNNPFLTSAAVASTAPNPILENTHIVMTHGPPKGILERCPQGSVGCPNLLTAIQRVKPLMHCFGHIHESHGFKMVDWNETLEHDNQNSQGSVNPYPELLLAHHSKSANGEKTLSINAAITTDTNKFENAPWIIDLDLPCRA
ncbi:MAG: hypothetical protein Q9178_003128 [Gyalolechia marmorata]